MSEIFFVDRVGPHHWRFVQDFGPAHPEIKFHLRFNAGARSFSGLRVNCDPYGWSPTSKLDRREIDILLSLLPAEEIARCAAASIMVERGRP